MRGMYSSSMLHISCSALLCCLWSFGRLFVRAASGRQRFNVLGAWNAVTRELIAVTNTTVVNTETMCELLRKIAARGGELNGDVASHVANGYRCMTRREITAAVVDEASELLRQGQAPADVADRLRITPYVAMLLAQIRHAPSTPLDPARNAHRAACESQKVDATTIRSIQRLLAIHRLRHSEIACDVGVSANLVAEVAAGKRFATTLQTRRTRKGEVFLSKPIRCGGCGAVICVVPCRACYTRLVVMLDRRWKSFSHGFPKMGFPAWRLLVVLLERLLEILGGIAMQGLITLVSSELSSFLSASDKREHLITRAEKLFDQIVEPIDLPGPDRLVDPILRSAIRPLVSRLYDQLQKKLEALPHA